MSYIERVGSPTIAINALIITRPDPGAVPGGSTNFLLITCLFGYRGRREGPKQDRRMGKRDGFRSGEARYRLDLVVANDNYAEEVALAA